MFSFMQAANDLKKAEYQEDENGDSEMIRQAVGMSM
jgi:hypothetical protein